MHSLILAAGEGSRLGSPTSHIPKLFVDIDGETLYERHLDAIESICDEVTVVLGHGFVEEQPDGGERIETHEEGITVSVCHDDVDDVPPGIKTEKIRDYLATDHDIDARAVVIPHWSCFDNGESCRLGLQACEDDVLLLNGDIVCRNDVLHGVVEEFAEIHRPAEQSVVAVKPGIQDEMTAVRWNDAGEVTDYGAIRGHQVAGIFVVHEEHVPQARAELEAYRDDWFPHAFPALPTTVTRVPHDGVYEINTPEHLADARRGIRRWKTARAPALTRE